MTPVLQIVVRLSVSLATGMGLGAISFAIWMLTTGQRLSFDQLNRQGPPVDSLAMGAGVGLLSTGIMLGVLFREIWTTHLNEPPRHPPARPAAGE